MKKKVLSVFFSAVWWQLLNAEVSNSTCVRSTDKCSDQIDVDCQNVDLRYRTIDGSCNNPQDENLGRAFTAYGRLLPPKYSDGLYAVRTAQSGRPLPSARLLSYKIFGRESIPDSQFTLLSAYWGQLIAHDTTVKLFFGYPGLKPPPRSVQVCCTGAGRYEETNSITTCLPIVVPRDDPSLSNYDCINFSRSVIDKDVNCSGTTASAPAEQLNGVSHYLDLSIVYGSDTADSHSLRTFEQGLLKTSDANMKWPQRTDKLSLYCRNAPADVICYKFGDFRGNQVPSLAAIQIVLLREHNRIAKKLAKWNTHWNDETLYQEARRINIAQYQYITYYEWIPNMYGAERVLQDGVIFNVRGGKHINDYDVCADPRSIQSFAHSALRYFHNLVPGKMDLVSEPRHVYNSSLRISHFMDNPDIIEGGCKYNSIVRGLSTQSAKRSDSNVDMEISENFMTVFAPRDIRSLDIQRDRDHGLPSYNDFREFCGLKRASTWQEFSDHISQENIRKMKAVYESHEDVDLSIGAALEKHMPDALVGHTFECLSLIQFKNLRKGDRYFFENGKQPHPFTEEQLLEIRKASVARLLCDNSDVESMQFKAFRKISRSNNLRRCSDLPNIDLRLWRER